MWLENPTFREDLEYIAGVDFVPWEKLRGKTLFITGATGLIGFNLISSLAYMNLKRDIPLKIFALVRDEAKARARFAEILAEGGATGICVGRFGAYSTGGREGGLYYPRRQPYCQPLFCRTSGGNHSDEFGRCNCIARTGQGKKGGKFPFPLKHGGLWQSAS